MHHWIDGTSLLEALFIVGQLLYATTFAIDGYLFSLPRNWVRMAGVAVPESDRDQAQETVQSNFAVGIIHGDDSNGDDHDTHQDIKQVIFFNIHVSLIPEMQIAT